MARLFTIGFEQVDHETLESQVLELETARVIELGNNLYVEFDGYKERIKIEPDKWCRVWLSFDFKHAPNGDQQIEWHFSPLIGLAQDE